MTDDSFSYFENEPQSTFADEEPKLKRGDLVIHDRTWQEIWQMAVTSPTVETYTDILRDRVVTVGRGAVWVLIAYIIAYIASTISQVLFGDLYSFGQETNNSFGSSGAAGLVGVICAPFFAAIGVGFWLLIVGIDHIVAKYFLRGAGNYDQLVFSMAAYTAPLTLIAGLAYLVPFVGLCVGIVIWLYMLYLPVVAMNATHQFGWGKSVLAVYAIPILLACAICGCFILVVGAASN